MSHSAKKRPWPKSLQLSRPKSLQHSGQQQSLVTAANKTSRLSDFERRWDRRMFSSSSDMQTPKKSSLPNAAQLDRNPQLRLLNALRDGSKPIMTFMGLPSFRAAQMIAQTGLDVRLVVSSID